MNQFSVLFCLVVALTSLTLGTTTTITSNSAASGVIEIFRGDKNNIIFQQSTRSQRSTFPSIILIDDLQHTETIQVNHVQQRSDSFLFTKTSLEINDNGRTQVIIWQGEILSSEESGLGYATFVLDSQGMLTGTFTTPLATYSIQQNANTEYYSVTETLWSAYAPEVLLNENENDKDNRLRSGELVSDQLPLLFEKEEEDDYTTNDSFGYGTTTTTTKTLTEDHASLTQVVVNDNDDENRYLLRTRHTTTTTTSNNNNNINRNRNLQTAKYTIDILAVVTNRARCELAGLSVGCELTAANKAIMEAKLETVQAQTNKALRDVATNVEIRLVDVYYLTLDLYPDESALMGVETDPNAQQWRNETGADLVALITGSAPGNLSSSSCGVARQNSFASATDYTCLDSFSFTHNIGHNLGCYHNRENSVEQHSYAHGFHYNNELRTIMAVNCGSDDNDNSSVSSNTCRRIPVFSTDQFRLPDNRPIGDANHKCAQRIRETAPFIEQWRDSLFTKPPTPAPTTSPTESPVNALPIIPTPSSEEPMTDQPTEVLPLTCAASNNSYRGNRGWFVVSQCTGENNMMHKDRLGFLVCQHRCVPEGLAQLHLSTGWECGPCRRRFFPNFGSPSQ